MPHVRRLIHLISVANYIPGVPNPWAPQSASHRYRISSIWKASYLGCLCPSFSSALQKGQKAQHSQGNFKECRMRDHGFSTWCLSGSPAGLHPR